MWCYKTAKLPECDKKTCYLCKVKTEVQQKERKIARKRWTNKMLKGKTARTDWKLNRGIGNQIHAALINTRENEYTHSDTTGQVQCYPC